MSNTARLHLPYIAPQQAQKQVTYNAAMALLDQLVQPAVKSRTASAPPGSPAEGDTYIVGPAGSGDWSGRDGCFAAFLSGSWSFTVPAEGWLAYVLDSSELAVFAGGAWASFVTTGGAALARLGINVAADLTTRLAVKSAASRFSHDGSSHRMAIDKAGVGDTASLLFEHNFSARAEIGLTGDDAFHLKVSPDGSTWLEALGVDQASGVVSLPAGRLAFPATQNPSTDANTLDDYEEGTWTPALNFGTGSTGITYSDQRGRYTKLGNLVTAQGQISLTSKGSSTGAAQIVGLPFASLNDSMFGSCAVGFASGFTSVVGAVLAIVQPNASKISLYQSANGAAVGLTQSQFTNTSALYFTAIYMAA
ncbi:MAG TPA: DUF2793 domain-containing protein [Devosia sp.]|nr:DUF2793 domain-containing protein [Devosia sp.]